MIAFFDWEVGEQIYVILIDEHEERAAGKITIDYPKETGGLYRLTGWTPDNKIGAIFRSNGESGLYTLPLKGGPATLVAHGGNPIQPHWSPDGKRIIHSNYVGVKEARDGWVDYGTAWVPAEGGEVTTIPIQADTKIVKAGWGAGNNVSPDAKTIVFAGRKVQEGISTSHIWTLPIEGGKPTQLTYAQVPLTDQFPCWSPDGKAIAFVRSRESENIGKLFTEADICIIPAAGGEPRQLTSESDNVAFGSIAWSPDGKLLAYLSIDNEWSPAGNTLRVIPAEGGESRVVTKLRRQFEVNVELAWSPDSRRIALNDGDIRIISLDEGSAVDIDPRLATTKTYHLDWSRDGEKLVFAGSRGGEVGFWLMENFLPQQAGK
jgi:Tol biopolymer transport system component